MENTNETLEQDAQVTAQPPATCRRCGGFVIMDYTMDLEDSSECLWLPIWRCISCGAMTEYKIMLHQLVQKSLPRLTERFRSRNRRSHRPVRLGV